MDEAVQGYIDGMDENSPTPSDNRSELYKHGFNNARDDKSGKPRKPAHKLRQDYQNAKSPRD